MPAKFGMPLKKIATRYKQNKNKTKQNKTKQKISCYQSSNLLND